MEEISENPRRPTVLIVGREGKPQEVSAETAKAMKEGSAVASRAKDLEREKFFQEHPESRGQRLVDAKEKLRPRSST